MTQNKINKRLVITCVSLLLVAALIASVFFLIDIFKYNTGVVTEISVRSKSREQLELKITYFLSMGGYSVRDVPEEEGEYFGDGIGDYDGSLGKYRIMVNFGDIEPHKSFVKKMSEDGVFELKGSAPALKAKFARPSDHGFVLYIGSDTPIHVEPVTLGELNDLFGILRILITVG